MNDRSFARLPLVLLIAHLFALVFGLIGLATQSAARGALGFYLPQWLVVVPVVLVSGDLHCAWVSTAGLRNRMAAQARKSLA